MNSFVQSDSINLNIGLLTPEPYKIKKDMAGYGQDNNTKYGN